MKRIETSELEELNLTEQELDAELSSESHAQLRNMVRSNPDESLSMSWRSGLNESLMAIVESKRRKRRFAWIVSPALGLGLAGALAFVFIAKTPQVIEMPTSASASHLEESLIATHRDAIRYSDISGVGLNQEEVVSRRAAPSYDLIEVGFNPL